MRCEINELREKVVLSTQIFDALASKRHVLAILQGLEEQQDLSTIARSIASPTRLQLGANSRPQEVKETNATLDIERMDKAAETEAMKAKEEMKAIEEMEETEAMEEIEALEDTMEMEEAEEMEERFDVHKDKNIYPDHAPARDWLTLTSRKESCQWPAALPGSLLIKQLISLYWVWIHPAHPILDMPLFLEHYETGIEKHCSPLLVSAVCVAACDVLDPNWEGIPGKATNVALLRQNLVAEALQQEASADPDAKTTTQALAIMSVVNTRSPGTV